MRRLAIAALLGCVVQFAAAHAQESSGPSSAPNGEDARFSYHRSGEAFVRLDSRTGQVATCARGPAGWTCIAAPEERAALEAEIGRLQRDNAALKKELLSRGLPLPGGLRPDPAPSDTPLAEAPRPPHPVPAPPSGVESEVAKVKAFVADVWRKLVGMVADLQKDMQRSN
jgi:hypothetical protein